MTDAVRIDPVTGHKVFATRAASAVVAASISATSASSPFARRS